MSGPEPVAVAEDTPLWFSAVAAQLSVRADPEYALAGMAVQRRYAQTAYPLERLGELALRVQYGSSERPEQSGNVRVVRMNNLDDARLDLTDHKWLNLPEADVARYHLEQGDLLFNRTNSKERVGKCAVFRASGDWVFASYLIRMSIKEQRATPEFIAFFLASPSGRLQIDRDSRQIIGMANINAAELRRFQIPLPSLSEQETLTAPLEQAREALVAARSVTAQTDGVVDRTLLSRLNVVVGDPDALRTFSVPAGDLRGQRLDALAHMPIVKARGSGPTSRVVRLDDIADINPKRPHPEEHGGMVPYVGLPECSQTHVERVILRSRSDPISHNVAQEGDILFARIEPSIFNRKYVFVRNLGMYDRVFTSAEFFIVRPRPEDVDPIFLHEVLLSQVVSRQVAGKTTGSTGRRRLDKDVFADLALPLPQLRTQEEIAHELRQIRIKAEETDAGAASAWRSAMSEFDQALFRKK